MDDRFDIFLKWCRGELDNISGKDYRAYQAAMRFLKYLETSESHKNERSD